MITINRIKDFTPGILNLFAIPIYNIGKIENDVISLRNAIAYYQLVFANDSLKANYTPQKSDAGEYYQIDIEGFMPGESVVNTKILNIIRKYRFLVIYQESDGTYRWTGGMNAGLQMELDYNSGAGNDNAKGYSIRFTGVLLNHPKPSQPYVKIDDASVELPGGGGTIVAEV
jgi:hypothetical protein